MDENNAKRSLAMCPLFESEVLVHLMLLNWEHPFANDETYRQNILETATEVLTVAASDSHAHVFIDGIKGKDMIFISAVWYAEFVAVQD